MMRNYTLQEAVEIGQSVTTGVTVLVGAAVALAVGVILVKLLWGWTVTDLFPGAVEQGLIAAELTWAGASKAVVLAGILSLSGRLVAGSRRQ